MLIYFFIETCSCDSLSLPNLGLGAYNLASLLEFELLLIVGTSFTSSSIDFILPELYYIAISFCEPVAPPSYILSASRRLYLGELAESGSSSSARARSLLFGVSEPTDMSTFSYPFLQSEADF